MCSQKIRTCRQMFIIKPHSLGWTLLNQTNCNVTNAQRKRSYHGRNRLASHMTKRDSRFNRQKTHAHKSSTTYAEPAPITVSHNWCKHDGKTRNEQPSSPRTALRLQQRIRSECNIPVNHIEASPRYNWSRYSHPFEERLKVL